MSKKSHGLKHHIVPTSIGGPKYNEENIYRGWKGREHYFYHRAFVNFAPSVAIKIIEGFTDENSRWNKILMSPDYYESLQKAFMGKEPANAIDFIRKEFLPIEEKWLRGELPEVELPDYQHPYKKIRRKKEKRGPKKALFSFGNIIEYNKNNEKISFYNLNVRHSYRNDFCAKKSRPRPGRNF